MHDALHWMHSGLLVGCHLESHLEAQSVMTCRPPLSAVSARLSLAEEYLLLGRGTVRWQGNERSGGHDRAL